MNKEIWKDIEGYEGYYKVSNFGNVKSVEREITMKHYSGKNAIHIFKEKNIFQRKERYAIVTLWKNNKCKRFLVHKLVASAFLDFHDFKYTDYDLDKVYSKEDLVINHKDGDKLNNNVENLEWCTSSYNNRYKIK